MAEHPNQYETIVRAKREPADKSQTKPADSKKKSANRYETIVRAKRDKPRVTPGPSSSVSTKQRGNTYESDRRKALLTPKDRGTVKTPASEQRGTKNFGSEESLDDIEAYRKLWVSDSDPIFDVKAATPEWPEPSSDPKYVDNLVETVSISTSGAGYVLHWKKNGRSVSAALPESWLLRKHNAPTVKNFGTLYQTRQNAIAALVPLILGGAGRTSVYVGVWSNDNAPWLFPTLFSDVSAPRIMSAIEAKDEQMRVAAREAEKETEGLLRGMLFSRFISGAYESAADPRTWEITAPKRSSPSAKAPVRTVRTPIPKAGSASATAPPAPGASTSTRAPRLEGTSSTTDAAEAPQSGGASTKSNAKIPANGVPDKATTLGSGSPQVAGGAPIAVAQGTQGTSVSPAISPPELDSKNVALSGETANTGGIKKIWAYREPDGTLRFKITGELKDPLARPHPNTPDFNRDFPTGNEIGLDFYEIAHLWGPGFGDEAMDGLMYAPREVNQRFQNEFIESRLRELHTIARNTGATVQVSAAAESYPLKTWGGHAILKEVSYNFQIRLPNGKTLQVGRVDISVPAPGVPGNVTMDVIPGSAGIWSLK